MLVDDETDAMHNEIASVQPSEISIHGITLFGNSIINFTMYIGILSDSLKNGEFDLQSEEASLAKQVAIRIVHYIANRVNPKVIEAFQKYLFGVINIWLSVRPTNSKIREQIWTRFCYFTSSDEYTAIWKKVYDAVGVDNSPILSFHTTLQLLYRLWKHHHPTTAIQTSQEIQHLSYDEQNALWYVAGYILRKLRLQLEKNRMGKDSEEQLALLECFVDDSYMYDNSDCYIEEIVDSQSWLRMIDRGGLTKCTNDFYTYLRVVEMVSKITITSAFEEIKHPQTCRDLEAMTEAIVKDTAVQRSWEGLVRDQSSEESRWSDCSSSRVQQSLIKLYIKIRCYAYSKKRAEHLKQENKESLQKSKSLRTKLSLRYD